MKRVPDIYFKLADSQAAADLVELIEDLTDEINDSVDDIFDFEEDEEIDYDEDN